MKIIIHIKNGREHIQHHFNKKRINIGRKNSSIPLDVALGGEHLKISRHHASIHMRKNAFYLEDKSQNGIIFKGKKFRQSEKVIREGERFRIGPYECWIEFVNVLLLRWLDVEQNEQIHFLEEEKALVIGSNDVCDLIFPSKYMPNLCAKIEYTLNGFTLENINNQYLILLNKTNEIVPAEVQAIQAGDVLKMGVYYFQVLPSNRPMLQCGNSDCQLLNEYETEKECRWCGFHLSKAGTAVARKF